MQRAVDLIEGWCRSRPIPGLTVEVHQLPGRTPLIVVEVPPTGGGPADDTVLLYGHLDKQPEMEGWRDGLGPWTPVLEGDRLYGRGAADDGYAAFASLTAIEAVHAGRRGDDALHRPDRGERGVRVARPAGLRRGARRRASASRAWWCASTPAASTTTGCGSRPRCAASREECCRSTSSPRVSTRATCRG